MLIETGLAFLQVKFKRTIGAILSVFLTSKENVGGDDKAIQASYKSRDYRIVGSPTSVCLAHGGDTLTFLHSPPRLSFSLLRMLLRRITGVIFSTVSNRSFATGKQV